MANTKISALTSATTPLAGTEVLPIVQSSATVKVATNDLTVRNVRANATTGILQVTGPAAASTRVMTVPDANFTAARTDAAQSFTGDQTLSTGNIIQGTAAKGFNFTANTPTAAMTSQLLNYYEEGTWTPTVTSLAGAITTVGSVVGRYTRIGRLVSVNLSVAITTNGTGSSAIVLTTLPIAASTSISTYSGDGYNGSSGKSLVAAAESSNNKVYIRYYDATYPVGSGETIYISMTYTV